MTFQEKHNNENNKKMTDYQGNGGGINKQSMKISTENTCIIIQ